MSALKTSRYVVWRVADLAAFPGAIREGRPRMRGYGTNQHAYVRYPWQKSVCSECGEPVWFQPLHEEHRVLVCWPCAGDAE